ncbi:cytochrome P450 [Infundibulicybe gibba]|nr:cytochrome P450 [Infundibulicybe gibba]
MLAIILQLAAAYSISWVLWRYLRPFIVKTEVHNIPGPPSQSAIYGNIRELYHANAWGYHKFIAEKYGNIARIDSFMGDKQIYVSDPKAMHHIIVKDQHIYEETDTFFILNRLAFGEGLLATMGDHHRKQRKMLNPVFSIAHMRNMVPIFYQIIQKLQLAFELQVKDGPQEIEIVDWMTRTALELIGQSGLGTSFDPLTAGAAVHPYCKSAKAYVPALAQMNFLLENVLPISSKIGPPKFRRAMINLIPLKPLHHVRDIVDVMSKTSVEILEGKKKALLAGDEALANQVGQGKDIMSILLRANMEADEKDRLPEAEVLGQITTFTFAAMDTTSGALSRILHLLATHQHVQDKLREELADIWKGKEGMLDYDELVSLPYLDAICRETLRLYPPVPTVKRIARQDVILPLSSPIRGLDGRELTGVALPKGTTVIVSIINSNRNPEIWGADSYEWKPERWIQGLPDSVSASHIPGIYSHLMTFLGGGRACIGFKFSQLEMKVVLSLLIRTLKFSPSASEKDVFWEMNGISSPIVRGAVGQQLPLKVSLAA